MNADYLWDKSATPDPEVQRLEELLAPYRSGSGSGGAEAAAVIEGGARSASSRGGVGTRRVTTRLLMAAGLLLAIGGAWVFFELSRGTWDVVDIVGRVQIGQRVITRPSVLAEGEWLETGEESSARIRLPAGLGRVDVRPTSRIRLLSANISEHRMQLAHGGVYVFVVAPPKVFFVETPWATAIDLGCSYTLDIGPDGAGRLEVHGGRVAFEREGRSSRVPTGAICLTSPRTGPGTPFFGDATHALQKALEKFDADIHDPRALVAVLNQARKRDTLTLWHLLSRVDASDRELVYDTMARLVPPPSSATRAELLRLDRAMLELWWDELRGEW